MKIFFKVVTQSIEYGTIVTLKKILGLCSPQQASSIGAGLGRIFSILKIKKTIINGNLSIAFPHTTLQERDILYRKIFENWVSFMAEAPQMKKLLQEQYYENLSIFGKENVEPFLGQKPVIFFCAHLGNLLIGATAIKKMEWGPVSQVYRPLNNKKIDDLFLEGHQKIVDHPLPKSPYIGQQLLRLLKRGQSIMVFTDQKENKGIEVPFFGIPAATGTAIIRLALHVQCPIIPVRTLRRGPFQFEATFYPPLKLEKESLTDTKEDDIIYHSLLQMNRYIEQWARDFPEQYWWFHRRFPKDAYGTQTKNTC
jgi:KDO2-lipid IV(A) lauroyltransferase